MKYRGRYLVRETEDEQWLVCERHGGEEVVLAWTSNRDVAHLIVEALEALPMTVAALEDWDAGYRDSPKLRELTYFLRDMRSARFRSELRFETHSALRQGWTFLLVALVGIAALLLLAFVLDWLARLL